MKVENKSKSKFIKFLNTKAFYGVLCICFLALGVAAWSGVEGFRNIKELENSMGSSSETPSQPSPNDTLALEVPSQIEDSNQNPIISKEETTTQQKPAEETASPVAAYFINPVLGEIIKDFSSTELQYSMTFRDMRLHKGIDIAAEAGTPVMAAGEGKVTAVYSDPLYGSVVEVDHGNGIVAKYCGLNSTPGVKEGDTVDSSTQLGAVDKIPCESVEEYHLHLEFILSGEYVSPSKYITN